MIFEKIEKKERNYLFYLAGLNIIAFSFLLFSIVSNIITLRGAPCI